MASGAVHTFIPANTGDLTVLQAEIESLVRKHNNIKTSGEERLIEECIEVRDDCIGLHHAEFLEIETILERLCVNKSEIIDGMVRVGAENKFGSMNAMKFKVEENGELPVVERVSYETNPDKKERTFTYGSVEVINPNLSTNQWNEQ